MKNQNTNIVSKLKSFAITMVASLILISCAKDNPLNESYSNNQNKVTVGSTTSTVSSQKLLAGQTIDAGTVTYNDVDTTGDGWSDLLEVSFDTKDGWEVTDIAFFVDQALCNLPTNKAGNPQVGQFPHKSGPLASGTTHRTMRFPFNQIGYVGPGTDDLFVAAHLNVRKMRPDGSWQTETAWGDGQRLVQKGNWAMSNMIFITQEPPTIIVDTLDATTETAFAYGGSQTGCFQNFSEFITNEQRWGWTNGPLAPGTYNFPIYAHAGQCDLSKGKNVGNLNVVYNGSTATVTYTVSGTDPQTFKNYVMKEVHLYVGSEQFPRNKQGELTIACGQYPKKASGLNTNTYSFTVTGLSGSVYLIAHAVVYGFPQS